MEEGSPKSHNFFNRIFGGHQNEEIEDEIISMVNEGHEQGVLHDSEAQMITNIFEFSDKEAREIMTHRSNIVAIDGNTTLQEAVIFMLNEKYSRYPVYIDNLDHIVGMIHVKDAFKELQEGKNSDKPVKNIKRIIREAKFVPETRNIDTLFRNMQALKIHIVIIIDEYGQTSGLIAMEDILEEIVGNILDEYDEDLVFIKEKGKDTYEIDGLTHLDELEERFGILFEDEEVETLNGFMVSRLERIPNPDDLFDMDYGGYNFKVLSVENKVIKRVLVTKLKEKNKQGEE
ncbi:MAG: HlyC/CorC family transporter [Lachnospiraceae bacterium]|nr:HlyC/CorC family transporter [Lachnospiraceae bacterium]